MLNQCVMMKHTMYVTNKRTPLNDTATKTPDSVASTPLNFIFKTLIPSPLSLTLLQVFKHSGD